MIRSVLLGVILVSSVAQAEPVATKGLAFVCERVFDTYATEDLLAAAARGVVPEQVCSSDIDYSRGRCLADSTAIAGSLGVFVSVTPVDASAVALGEPMPVFVMSVFDTAVLDTQREISIRINHELLEGGWRMTPEVPFTLVAEVVPALKEGEPWILAVTSPSGSVARVPVTATKVDAAASLTPRVAARTTAKDTSTTTTLNLDVMAKGVPEGSFNVLLHELRGLALEVTLD